MLGLLKLRNPVRNYAWGSRTAIAGLLGRPTPSPEPEAELWMGSHPQAPSEAFHDGRWRPLPELVRESPAEVLGPAAHAGGGLSFLLKVLAADEPLSIQAHPDANQSRRGFAREEAAGIPRDAAERNYRDPHPKPEVLYALTPFAVVRGFRAPGEIHHLLARLGLSELLDESAQLLDGDLRGFFSAWMTRPAAAVADVLDRTVDRCAAAAVEDPALPWVTELAERHPGDRGVLAPLFLNVAQLSPGEAIHTGPGVLHAYLRGVGIELMTSSDNVLRGGLTVKHVDVPELLDVLRFEPQPFRRCRPAATTHGVRFATDGLRLEVLDVRGEARADVGRAAILLCGDGAGTVRGTGGAPSAGDLPFARGDSFLIPATVAELRVTGSAKLFLASVAED